jgi:hypothetical protein
VTTPDTEESAKPEGIVLPPRKRGRPKKVTEISTVDLEESAEQLSSVSLC